RATFRKGLLSYNRRTIFLVHGFPADAVFCLFISIRQTSICMSTSQTAALNLRSIVSIVKAALRGGDYDYTSGSIRKAIVLLSIPMILELSLESVFAVVDMYFVSHLKTNATEAMATVGLTESVIAIVYTFALGLN